MSVGEQAPPAAVGVVGKARRRGSAWNDGRAAGGSGKCGRCGTCGCHERTECDHMPREPDGPRIAQVLSESIPVVAERHADCLYAQVAGVHPLPERVEGGEEEDGVGHQVDGQHLAQYAAPRPTRKATLQDLKAAKRFRDGSSVETGRRWGGKKGSWCAARARAWAHTPRGSEAQRMAKYAGRRRAPWPTRCRSGAPY